MPRVWGYGFRARRFAAPRNDGIGAAEGIRTPDPRITNAVLYRLSYRGGPTGKAVIPGKS